MCFFFFFPPRLEEVWGMRLKDRFLTHGGLALWSENTSGVDACLFHSAAVPPSTSSSLPLLHPSPPAHCALVTHSSFSPLLLFHSQSGWSQRPRWQFPWVLTSVTRHKQPTSSCGKTTWHPLISSQEYFFPSDLQLYIFHHRFLLLLSFFVSRLITSPSCVSFTYIHLHLLLPFSSLICSLLILLFLPALCQPSQVRHQPQLIPVHLDNNYSSSNEPQPKSTCWMPLAPLLSQSITLSENLFRMGESIWPKMPFTEHGLQDHKKRNI